MLIVHGLGEHIGRYGRVAASLNAAGWPVVGFFRRAASQAQTYGFGRVGKDETGAACQQTGRRVYGPGPSQEPAFHES